MAHVASLFIFHPTLLFSPQVQSRVDNHNLLKTDPMSSSSLRPAGTQLRDGWVQTSVVMQGPLHLDYVCELFSRGRTCCHPHWCSSYFHKSWCILFFISNLIPHILPSQSDKSLKLNLNLFVWSDTEIWLWLNLSHTDRISRENTEVTQCVSDAKQAQCCYQSKATMSDTCWYPDPSASF